MVGLSLWKQADILGLDVKSSRAEKHHIITKLIILKAYLLGLQLFYNIQQ